MINIDSQTFCGGLLLAALTITVSVAASESAPAAKTSPVSPRHFEVRQPDKARSPFTGATREHWIECGQFILEGAFAHVKGLDDPILFPKVPGVSYPKEGYDKCSPAQRSAAIFEGVARTFNVASPLLAENPDLTLNGIRLADYYKLQMLKLTDPTCPYFIGYGNTHRGPQQQTCELGNLALWMLLQPQVLWDRLNQTEKDQVAKVMLSWSDGWTKTHNWRWFNVMMLTFLKQHDYAIDEALLRNHLDHLLMLESGEGWFRDKGHDYYTAHVFQLYGAVWNRTYGWKHEPARAAVIDRQFHSFMDSFKEESRGGTPCFVDMADIVIPGGKICIRRFRKVSAATLFEGHFGLPHLGGAAKVSERTVDGRQVKIARIPGRQLALTSYRGWDTLADIEHTGLNAEAKRSTLLHVSRTDPSRYGAPELLISVMLQKTDDSAWPDDALQPIKRIEPLDPRIPEVLGGLRVHLKSGRSYPVNFQGIDGSSSR